MSHDRKDVEVLPASRLEAAHNRAAQLVKDQRTLCDRLDKFFGEVAEVRELLRAEGSVWEGPVLDPPVEAAFAVWLSKGPREARVEFHVLPAAPMMELE